MLKERAGRSKLNALGKMRAMELQMEHPQTMDDTQLETTTEMRGSGSYGGGEAGMKRIIGGAKRRGRPKKAEMMAGASDGIMEGGAMMSGGAKMGKELGDQMLRLHGEGFFSDFLSGLKSVLKPVASVASFIPGPIGLAGNIASAVMGNGKCGMKKMKGGASDNITAPPSGRQVSHAMMSPAEMGLAGQALGGQDVPPGGVAPVAYGNAPQAPASFARNAVGEGMLGGPGRGIRKGGAKKAMLGLPGHGVMKGSARPAGAGVASGAGKRSARGQAIAKLMKEKGMTLPQASKYLKEHGSA